MSTDMLTARIEAQAERETYISRDRCPVPLWVRAGPDRAGRTGRRGRRGRNYFFLFFFLPFFDFFAIGRAPFRCVATELTVLAMSVIEIALDPYGFCTVHIG